MMMARAARWTWMLAVAAVLIVGSAAPVASGADEKKEEGDYALPAMPAEGKFFVKEGDFDGDGKPEVLVETKLLRLVFDPKIGGRVGSWVYKPTNHDFTNRPGIRVDGGMLADHVSQQGYWGDWAEAEYDFKIEELDDRVLVHLSCRGKTGPLAYIVFNKTVTILPDSAAVRVDYDIQNDVRSTVPLTYGIWFHNCAVGRKETGPRYFFFPTEAGIMKLDVEVPRDQEWLRGPGRGWAGAIASKTKTGLSAAMDNRYMKMHYTWIRGMVVPTFEWRFLPAKIETGHSFRTTQTYLAFSGLDSVNGAGASTAGSLKVVGKPEAGKPVKVAASVVGAKPMKVEVLLTAQRLPKGAVIEVGRQAVAIPHEGAVTQEFSFTPPEEGTYALVAAVVVNNQTDCELEEPLQVGKASAAYALLPKVPRLSAEIGPKSEDVDVTFSSMDVETPHVKWAKPYAWPAERKGKRLKALMLCEDRGMREIVELKQRVDIDVDTSFLAEYYPNETSGDLGHLLSKELLVKRALKFFEPEESPYDVVIVSGPLWNLLGKFAGQRVREWTKAGTGLIVVGATDKSEAPWDILPIAKPTGQRSVSWDKPADHDVTRGLPYSLLPRASFWQSKATGRVVATAGKYPAVVVGEAGKGRVVAITYKTTTRTGIPTAGLTPVYMEGSVQEFKTDYWEYHFSMLARAMLWAAKVEPNVKLSVRAEEGKALDRTSGLSFNYTIKSRVPTSARASYSVKQGAGRRTAPVSADEVSVDGEVTRSVVIPAEKLRAGANTLDVWIKDADGRVVDWTTVVLDAPLPIEVESIKLAKASFERDEAVIGEAKLNVRGPTDGQWVRVSIVDPQGRALWRSRQDVPEDGVVKFAATVPEPIFCAHDVVVDVGRDASVFASTRKEFYLGRRRTWDDFHGTMWGSGYIKGGRMYFQHAIARMFRENGITGVITNPYDWYPNYVRANMAEGLYPVAKGGGWGRPSDPTNDDPARPIRKQSPIDDKVLASVRAWGKGYGQRARKYSAISHMMGDENAWSENWAPDYLAKFRKWLEEEYGTVTSLNAEWGTRFKEFDKVTPLTTDEAREERRYAPWVDFRRFDSHALATYFATMRKSMHEADPEASLEISGSNNPWATNSHNWSRLGRSLDSVRCYGVLQTALIHAFAPETRIAPYVHGLRGNPEHMHPRIWRGVFEGAAGYSTCSESQNINPDLTPTTGLLHLGRNYVPLRSGIGKALIHAEREAPIALHYSHASQCVAYLLRRENQLVNARLGLFDAIPETGRAMRFVDRRQIEEGFLQKRGTRVLVLAHAFALSDKEAREIRRFVEDGGTVFADLAPGLYTEHGRRRISGALDGVFGVTRVKPKFTEEKSALVTTTGSYGIDLAGEAPVTTVEGGIVSRMARAGAKCKATGQAALFVRRAGRGWAVLVNGDIFTDYQSLAEGRHFPAYAERLAVLETLLDKVLTKAGVPAIAQIATRDGADVAGKYLVSYKAGKVRYVGLLRNQPGAKEPLDVTMTLPERVRVYDVLEGRRRGRTNRIRWQLNPVQVKVFALTPYAVRGIKTDLPRSARQGDVLRFNVAVSAWTTPGDHVIRMDVVGPDGDTRPHLARNILAKEGQGQAVLPFALNDPVGRWAVHFHDVTSGKRAKRAVRLSGN